VISVRRECFNPEIAFILPPVGGGGGDGLREAAYPVGIALQAFFAEVQHVAARARKAQYSA
jgi:hypothetical protein